MMKIDWGGVKVDDPDPTPQDADLDALCGEGHPVEKLICTRWACHTGNHVAGNGREVAAVWNNEAG